MKCKTLRNAIALASVAGCASFSGVANADLVDLPDPNCGYTSAANNCLIFDDFTVFSLGLLTWFQNNVPGAYAGYDFTYKPNEAILNVIDSAGQGTDAQGPAGAQDPATSIDDPFRAMEGGSSQDNMRFLMAGDSITTGSKTIPSDPLENPSGTWDNRISNTETVNVSNTFTRQERFGPKPYQQFAGGETDPCYLDMNTAGCMQSWDADIDALKNALDGKGLVFMFGNNETGDAGTLAGQDLLAWARVTLHNGSTTGALTFEFSGNNNPYDALFQTLVTRAQSAGVDDILPTTTDKWGYVHSEICINQVTYAVYLGMCKDSGFGTDGKTVNQSLGNDQAGFAVYNKQLSDLVSMGSASGYKYFTMDVRFSHLNNGGDNLWIMGADFGNQVPEPATLGLLGAGLLSIGGLRRRAKGG